ncbi:MAG: cation-translocating P-type ATPase [Coriobacteriales bacterium]|jgi:Cd2+/Zn2+-exporting ATPase|nr:cation-translocating P-type ATPase [Coriobacteriales bacterium]
MATATCEGASRETLGRKAAACDAATRTADACETVARTANAAADTRATSAVTDADTSARTNTADVACCKHCEAIHATPRPASANDADDERDEESISVPKLIVCGVFAIAGVLLHTSGLQNVAGISAPLVATALSIIGIIFGLWLIAAEVIEAVRERRIDINILMVIAVVGAVILGDFSEAGAVVFFFAVGEWLEEFAIQRNRASIEQLMELSPQTVRVIRDGATITLSPEEVLVGERVVVRPGERIPLDGIVASGTALVDESPITGESIPVHKSQGAQVFSGSLSVDGRLEYQTTATVANSTLARIVALVEESQAQRSPTERFINRFARFYTPAIVLIALLVALLPPLLSLTGVVALGGFDVWVYRGLSLLVIGCPCSLVIATPVAVVCALARCARIGILVKGGAFLELGSKAKVVAFDKTGTLTWGRPEVAEVVAQGVERDEVLRVAYALERDSIHPLARAIVIAFEQGAPSAAVASDSVASDATTATGAAAAPLSVPAASVTAAAPSASAITETAGKGIAGVLDGVPVRVGSAAFIGEALPEAALPQNDVRRIEAEAGTALLVAQGNRVIGVIAVRDVLRAEAPTVVRQLKTLAGVERTVILSGDNQMTADAVAAQAGVSEVRAGLLPQDKMEQIQQLRERYGVVVMVGDGINDAPALAQTDIGIAMGAAGSDTALEVADVALMANNLNMLPQFFVLARRTLTTIKINVAFALAFKLFVMALTIVGLADMWMAIVADVGVLLLVVLHSMTLLVRRLPG